MVAGVAVAPEAADSRTPAHARRSATLAGTGLAEYNAVSLAQGNGRILPAHFFCRWRNCSRQAGAVLWSLWNGQTTLRSSAMILARRRSNAGPGVGLRVGRRRTVGGRVAARHIDRVSGRATSGPGRRSDGRRLRARDAPAAVRARGRSLDYEPAGGVVAGLDRPFRRKPISQRFAGEQVEITLQARHSRARKHCRGRTAGARERLAAGGCRAASISSAGKARARPAVSRRSISLATRCARHGSCR